MPELQTEQRHTENASASEQDGRLPRSFEEPQYKVFGQAFFKKLAGRGEFAEQTHSEAGESPRRSPQRAKLPQPSESEEKGGLGEETPKGVSAPIHRSFAPLNTKMQNANPYL